MLRLGNRFQKCMDVMSIAGSGEFVLFWVLLFGFCLFVYLFFFFLLFFVR